MARKKSKGSKKARARKSRAKKAVEAEVPASTDAESPSATSQDPDEKAPPKEERSKKERSQDEPAPREKTTRAKKKATSGKKATGKKEPKAEKRSPTEDDSPTDEAAAEEIPDAPPIPADDVVTVAIDPDEDVDDPEVRERLIAEALAFVADDVGAGPDEASGPVDAATAPSDGAAEDEPSDPPVRDDVSPPTEDAPPPAGTPPVDEAAPEGDAAAGRPQMTPQALLALSEIHAEGLASLPEELVLDLGEGTTEEERDRLLAAALAHVEMQDAVYRVNAGTRRARRIKTGIATGILVLAALVAVTPPSVLVPDPPPSVTPADREHGIRIALLLQAQQVEAFRVETGRLPNSIAEVDSRLPGIRLVKSSNRLYQLIAYARNGEPIVYDSEVPGPEFERLRRTWSTTRDES